METNYIILDTHFGTNTIIAGIIGFTLYSLDGEYEMDESELASWLLPRNGIQIHQI